MARCFYLGGFRQVPVNQIPSAKSNDDVPGANVPMKVAHFICLCQVRVYSGRESGQVWTKADEGREQRAGQEVSPAGVGDRVDSTTKDNEH